MADFADISDASVDAERDAVLAAITNKLSRPGTIVCIGCGEEISAARRNAAPWAIRCIDCQLQAERREDG